MTKQLYVEKSFREAALNIIAASNAIIEEYSELGFTLTLRQLYYQFVARGWLANKQTEYNRLGAIVNDARLAGLIDWAAIEDRTRSLRKLGSWDTPQDILASAAVSYREDLWSDQDVRAEVWIEKDALVGVIERVCNRWRVPFFSCRGYPSQSAVYEAAARHKAYRSPQGVEVIHLGDHDPSGLNMTEDLENRFSIFGSPTTVNRVALNMNQVLKYSPPPNPAKLTDSRAADYIRSYGENSWELDSMTPDAIEGVVEAAILGRLDRDKFDAAEEHEDDAKARLYKIADEYEDDTGSE